MTTGEAASNAATRTGAAPSASSRTSDIDLVILVLADGFRPDVLQALCASGELPNISRYLLEEGSYHEGVTVLPSVTDVAYLPMLTGQYPGVANMPGIRWLEKSRFIQGAPFGPGQRSYVGPTHLKFDGDMPDGLETVFELCPGSLAVRSDIHRGLSPGLNRFYGTAIPFMFLSHYLKRADFIDRLALGSLLRALRKMNGNLPRFVFLPLLDVDTASHARGPEHRRTFAAYRRVDAAIGVIIEWLRGIGIWSRTHFLMVSDHGHTATREHLDLRSLVSEMGYRVFEHPNIFQRRRNAAVAISGNAFANVYLASESGWVEPLLGDELEGGHGRLLQALRGRPEVEWIAYRHTQGAIKIASGAGTALLNKEGEHYTYSYEDSDPLRLGLARTPVHESDALDVTADTAFPDALEQIWQLFKSSRTGDLVVTSRPGYDLRGWRERPEHHSSHGALCSEHMNVPILSNRPLSSEGPVRTVDLFPTIVESLGLAPTKPYPGRSLW